MVECGCITVQIHYFKSAYYISMAGNVVLKINKTVVFSNLCTFLVEGSVPKHVLPLLLVFTWLWCRGY